MTIDSTFQRSRIIDYVTEEVWRQGHDITEWDGICRVSWMLKAWACALEGRIANAKPTFDDAIMLGQIIEPVTNVHGIRKYAVVVGGQPTPRPEQVQYRLSKLFDTMNAYTPLEFYKEFELVHPFGDGNGRTGKILLNWLNGSLHDPIFPPQDLWGRPIRNP